MRTRCSRAPLLALGRCARSQVWQRWAASLFKVFPAPRWSSVSTRERHRHCGPLGVRPRRPAGGAAGAGAIGQQIGVGLPGLRLVHRASQGAGWPGVLAGGSDLWRVCSRQGPGSRVGSCVHFGYGRAWGWVSVPAPATGHPHRDKIIAPRAGPLLGTASTRWAANSRLPQVPPLSVSDGTS